ncbi:MAG: hypothetical protein AAF203_02215 [Pseudomonadota bacterium]
MKKLILTLIIALGAQNAFAVSGCPLEAGEVNECDYEQQIVEQALIGVQPGVSFSYCLFETSTSADSEGLQCRGPVMYVDGNGLFNDQIFEDRFITSEVDRVGAFQIYFVKQSNGKYSIYGDDTADGVLNINRHEPMTETDIEVTFSSELRPQFTTRLINTSTGTVELGTSFVHTRFWTELRRPDGSVIKRYNAINAPQVAPIAQATLNDVK